MRLPASSLPLLLRTLRLPPLAPVLGLRHFGHGLLLAMALLLLPFALHGAWRPMAEWRWMDIVGEGGMGLMVGVWLAYLRASRPAGPVTNWLCLGMSGMLLGAYVDVLDEFWMLPKAVLWDNWLESTLTPLGMVLLTWGLHRWRQEQLALNRQLARHERVFRDHRRIDALTQLGDAAYMAAQIALERRAGRAGSVLMLGWRDFDTAVARRYGLAEADRMLRAAGLLLTLHLGPDELLCRYAGDRFVVLLPGRRGEAARAMARQLQAALSGWSHSLESGERLALPADCACTGTDDEALAPDTLLMRLAAQLHDDRAAA